MVEEGKTCFVICPIGDEGSIERKRADQILRHIISPAVTGCGYKEPDRSDLMSQPGIITSQIIDHLIHDDLVIADLTGRNPNVFYELAVRHAFRKPVIQLISSLESIPFDVASMRTIQFDYKDLDSAASCKQEIISQIQNIEKNPLDVNSPISVAVDIESLGNSQDAQERGYAEIMLKLEHVSNEMASLKRRGEQRSPTPWRDAWAQSSQTRPTKIQGVFYPPTIETTPTGAANFDMIEMEFDPQTGQSIVKIPNT